MNTMSPRGADPSSECARSCEEIEHLLDQEQALITMAELLEHSQTCPECALLFDFEAHLRRVIRESLGPPPRIQTNDLHLRVRVTLRRETLSHLQLTRITTENADGTPENRA